MNIAALVSDLERAALESCALAFLTYELHVSEKLHLHCYGSIALASLTTSSWYVEGKMAGVVTSLFSFRRAGQSLAYQIERLYVGHGVGPRCPADGRLVD